MLPIRDENPTSRTPVVTLLLIALNVAAFLLWQPTLRSRANSDLEQAQFFYCNALIPFEVEHQTNMADAGLSVFPTTDPGDIEARRAAVAVERAECPDKSWLLSVFASMFLHGGWLHIAGNMLFLWVFGNNVEDRVGPFLYLLFYLGAGVAATVTQLVLGGGEFIPNVGASGAIAGVLGAYLVMFPRRRVLTLVFLFFITTIYLPAILVLGLWFVLQFFNGVAALTTDVAVGGGVAFWAHIGGFVFGALLAVLFFPKERLWGRPPPARADIWGRRGRLRGWGRSRWGDDSPY